MEFTLFDQKITLRKIFHNGQDQLAIHFNYNLKVVEHIKTLPDRKYSKTHSCWYLPYTKSHYQKVLDLVKEEDKTVLANKQQITGTIENAHSQDVHTGISSPTEEQSVLPPVSKIEAADIRADVLKKNVEIVLNSGCFFIRIAYQKTEVDFIKSLEGVYWNEKFKNWVVKASSLNLSKIQEHYLYWDEANYLKCYTLIMELEDPYRVEIYCSPEFPKHFALKLKGSRADFDFLKALPDRDYHQEFKRWIIPKEKVLLDRIIDHYTADGAKVINKVTLHHEKIVEKGKDYHERKEFLLSKFQERFRPQMALYMDTLIRKRYSWNTINTYAGNFIKFVEFFDQTDVAQLTTAQVNQYISVIANKKVSDNLLHSLINAIKFYYSSVIFRTDFKLDEIQRPKQGHTLPKLLSVAEVDRMLRSLENLKHVTLLYALYSSGFRLQELLDITINDIYWDRNQIMVRGGKGKKDRMVMLSAVLKEIFKHYFDVYQPKHFLFEGQDGESQYSSRSVQQVVKQAAKKAGITRVVTPHVLRHCFATHLLDNGTDVRYIQELLGHKDIKTTLIYTHVTTAKLETIKSPLDQLNLGDRFGKTRNLDI